MSINLMSAIFRTEFRDLQDNEGNTTKASTAKFVCIALADHANDEGEGAYPSINKIAYKTNLSRSAVINALDALKHNGILTANGTSKWDTVNYTVKSECFSQDSKPALLVNPIDSPQYPQLTPPVFPVDPNHPLTIHKPSMTDEEKGKYQTSKRQLANTSIEAAIFGGMPITEEMMIEARLKDEAPKMFEAALGFSRPLAWTSDKDWTSFGAWVLDVYRTDPKAFERFETWRNTPYVKGSISNNRIRGFVNEFYDAWDMFKKQDAPQNNAPVPVTYNSEGMPESW